MNFLIVLLRNSLACCFFLMPLKLRWWVSRFFAWIFFDVIRFRRWTILRNLTIAFPNWDKARKYAVARESVANLCYNFIEFWLLGLMNTKNMDRYVVFEGLEHYERARAQGKGILLLSLHLAHGDAALNFMALKGMKIHVISKLFRVEFLNELWFGVRKRRGMEFFEPHAPKTAFSILKACKAKEAVLFVIDQFMGKPFGIETRFFGRKTGTAYGLALFTIKTGAPVLPVYTYRDERFLTHVAFEPEVEFIEHENRDLQIQILTQKYNDRVENLVRKYPEQWMWIHRRWKVWE